MKGSEKSVARKRMIDPSIWESQDFSDLPDYLTKLVFIGLFSLADDEGRGSANPCLIKSKLFPYSESLRVADIKKSLAEIAAKMSVIFYKTCDGKEYYALTNWDKWQSVPKPSPSSIPEYNEDFEILYENREFGNSSVGVQNRFGNGSVTVQPKRKESKGKEKKEKESITPRPSPFASEISLIAESWNKLKDNNVTQISGIEPNSHRYKLIIALLNKYGIDCILKNIEKIGENSFLCGDNDRGWTISFDWFIKADNFLKVSEGNYKNNSKKHKPAKNSFNNFTGRDYSDDELNDLSLQLLNGSI